MTSTSFGLGELVHVLGLAEKDPRKHVTVTDVFYHDGETHVVTVDGYGTQKTWSELDLRVASGRIPPEPRRPKPATLGTAAAVQAELVKRGIAPAPSTPKATPDPPPISRAKTIPPPPEDW